jgi:hypothetical protein
MHHREAKAGAWLTMGISQTGKRGKDRFTLQLRQHRAVIGHQNLELLAPGIQVDGELGRFVAIGIFGTVFDQVLQDLLQRIWGNREAAISFSQATDDFYGHTQIGPGPVSQIKGHWIGIEMLLLDRRHACCPMATDLQQVVEDMLGVFGFLTGYFKGLQLGRHQLIAMAQGMVDCQADAGEWLA